MAHNSVLIGAALISGIALAYVILSDPEGVGAFFGKVFKGFNSI